ncbi:MAG: branched-chain amino acid ABC transporter permease [Spirochaetales bacterium]
MKRRNVLVLLGALLLVALPFLVTGFWVRLVTQIFMFAALASALNIISGFTGYAAFGNMIFFGLGAYTTAVLMTKANLSFLVAFPASGVMAVLLAVVLGLLLLRLRGHYFALGSLGAMEAFRQIVDLWTGLTGGSQGITVPAFPGKPFVVNTFFYFAMLALVILIVAFVSRLDKNRLGYAFKAIRADEEAANVMGIDTTQYKIISWSISAFFTGLIGSVYAYWFSYIDPPTVFNVMWVVNMFVIMLIGGMGTVYGPVVGAVILETVSELVWSKFINLHLGILGAIIILAVLFMPKGVLHLNWNWVLQRLRLADAKEEPHV